MIENVVNYYVHACWRPYNLTFQAEIRGWLVIIFPPCMLKNILIAKSNVAAYTQKLIIFWNWLQLQNYSKGLALNMHSCNVKTVVSIGVFLSHFCLFSSNGISCVAVSHYKTAPKIG